MKQFQPEMLLNPKAYDESVSNIEIRNKYFSWIFLTGEYSYKVKKPLTFGEILDYTTLELRKKYCEEEIEVNSRFTSDIYIDTFWIDKSGKINGEEEIIEYGVRMKQIPEKYLLSNLLEKRNVTKKNIENIAKNLASFHAKTDKVPEYGDTKYIGEKWDESFRSTSKFKKINMGFRDIVGSYLRGNRGLFKERINEGRITDNHGDFQSRNIYILPREQTVFVDCLEFNSLLRYGDVAEDVGFLAMDLDFWEEKTLSDHFVKSYIDYSKDDLLEEHILFFKCYRAYVRGKFQRFQAEMEPNENEKKNSIALSEKFYNLSYKYAENL